MDKEKRFCPFKSSMLVDYRNGARNVRNLFVRCSGSKKCPKSDACEHWRTCEMCNGVMGQCKKKQRIEKAR